MPSLNPEILTQTLQDGGPLYRETHLENTWVEPYNSISAFLFFAIAAYYLVFKRTPDKVEHKGFLRFSFWALAVGGIGGTLFHGLRVYRVFYLMDVLPIGVLTLAVTLYFWRDLLKNWKLAILPLLPVLVAHLFLFHYVARQWAISASYVLLAASILTPIFLVLKKMHYLGLKQVLSACGFFVLAVFFRSIDAMNLSWFPMGTHWLWHCFSAVSVYYLIEFLFTYHFSVKTQAFSSKDHSPSSGFSRARR